MKKHWLLAISAFLVLGLSGCGPAGPKLHSEEAIPDRLADWGLVYRDGSKLVWSEPTTVYDLNTPLFTDYAHKMRTVYVPPGAHVREDENGRLRYPVGTIFTKTFYYPAGDGPGEVRKAAFEPAEIREGLDMNRHRVVETRLLVHYESGWKAISYVWNQKQTEARRKITGAVFPLTLVSEDGKQQDFPYVVPDANQCTGCHATTFNTRQPMPIGPSKPDYMNRSSPLGTGNQLADWQQRGWLKTTSTDWEQAPDWQDTGHSVESRARAYLEINCAHCHSATGAGDTSGLWLSRDVELGAHLGICKPPIAAGQGTGGNPWSIDPGRPDSSILLYRMASLDPGAMMPELGRSLVHDEGVELVRQWIAGLEGECGEPESIGAFSRSR